MRDSDRAVFMRNTMQQDGWGMCCDIVSFIFKKYYFVNEIRAILVTTAGCWYTIEYECHFDEFEGCNYLKFNEYIIYGTRNLDLIIYMLDDLKAKIELNQLKKLNIKAKFM